VCYASLSPHNAEELFVVGQITATYILKSTDKGQSWQVLSKRNQDLSYPYPLLVNKLIFHPTNKDVVYTIEEVYATEEGLENRRNNQILKSTDGGKTWTPLTNPFSQEISDIAKLCSYPRDLYVEINDIAIPFPSILYAATNYGVYKSIDEGKIWELSGFGLPSIGENPLLAIDPYTNSIFICRDPAIRGSTGEGGTG